MKKYLVVLNNGEKFYVEGTSLSYGSGNIIVNDENDENDSFVAILTNIAFITNVSALAEPVKEKFEYSVK